MMRSIAFSSLLVSTGALVPNKVIGVPKMLNTKTYFDLRHNSRVLHEKQWHAPRAMQMLSVADEDMMSDSEQMTGMCVAILEENPAIEKGIADGSLNYDLDFDGFSNLIERLNVPPCTQHDRQIIFAMIDEDSSGTISVLEIKKAVQDSEFLDSDRVRTVCIAVLGQVGKIEDCIEDGSIEEELDVNGFSVLMDKLKITCTDQDKKVIFAMIDVDCTGQICASKIKSVLRSSGAISTMYSNSLKSFGLLVAATLVFGGGILATRGPADAFDFFTAYVVEDSLSVDNLFVFLLLFRYFNVPPQLVDTCLNYGIGGSIVLRGLFIYAGLAAANAFAPLNLIFSGFLLFSSYQLLVGGDEDEDEEPPEVILTVLDTLPLTGTFEGDKFFAPGKDGSLQATQLTATLITLALCDVLFAVDSIPAVLAINDDPFIVYTSNIAAVIGLRTLYQLLSVAVTDLIYLEKSVAIVLGFVGLKLGLEVAGVEVSSGISLGVILVSLGGGILLSYGADDEAKDDYEPKTYSKLLSMKRQISVLIGVGED